MGRRKLRCSSVTRTALRCVDVVGVVFLAALAVAGIFLAPSSKECFQGQQDHRRTAALCETVPTSTDEASAPPKHSIRGWSSLSGRPLNAAKEELAPPSSGAAVAANTPQLSFVHIPLNGGRIIEELSTRMGLGWTSPDWPSYGEPVVLGKGYPCSKNHVPPSLLATPHSGIDTFCIIRDPYERLVEEFKTEMGNARAPTPAECIKALNTFVFNSLKWAQEDAIRSIRPFALNCRFLPQTAFVYGWDADSARVDEKQRSCKHTLRFESLHSEANALLESHGYKQRLEDSAAVPTACPAMDKWSLGLNSRELIEHTFRDDFRLLGFAQLTTLEFIHIPRTGGSAVEEAAKLFYTWGSMNTKIQGLKQVGTGKCQGHHAPPSFLKDAFSGKQTFCIVRNVFDKMLSEFRLKVVDTVDPSRSYKCSVEDLNRFIQDLLTGRVNPNWAYPYGSDCHFLPQGAYVYDWDPVLLKFDTSKRWCTHVVRYERLHEDINSLWQSQGYPIRLHKQVLGPKGRDCPLKRKDFSNETAKLIRSMYMEDFAMLERLRAEGPTWLVNSTRKRSAVAALQEGSTARSTEAPPAPPERHLLLVEQDIERGKLVLDDVVTAQEFELSFQITVRSEGPPGMSSILRLTSTDSNYGGVGDRMPAFMLHGKPPRLAAYMGHHGNHNAVCTTLALPLGQMSQIVARLEGTAFTVYVDGKKGCSVGGYERKFSRMDRVALWIGDQFHSAADAALKHVVYRTRLSGKLGQAPESTRQRLAFVGIPLNGEPVADEHAQHSSAPEIMTLGAGYPCIRPYVPPSFLPSVHLGEQTFCILRDPYERIVSEFRRMASLEAGELLRADQCKIALNTFVHSKLKFVLDDDAGPRHPYASNCQFMPQAAYVYGWSPTTHQVDPKQRSCSHVLRHEQLEEDTRKLFEEYDHPQRLERQTMDINVCPMLGRADLDRTSSSLIESVFRDDFRLLGLEHMDGSAPAVRTLVVAPRKVNHSTLVLDNLRTTDEFEFSFDLTPLRVVDNPSSIISLTNMRHPSRGHADWMLDFSFLGGSTVLECQIGQPGNPDSKCVSLAPGLPLRRASQIRARLLGGVFSVHVDGTAVCTTPGNTRRYGTTGGVQLWMGQGLSQAADALVGNVHYKAKQDTKLHGTVSRAPPLQLVRTLLAQEIKIEHKRLVASDIITAEDFEISFDLMLRKQSNAMSLHQNIFQFTSSDTQYGHPGDRMPALFHIGGTTSLVAYMGHAHNHNAACRCDGELPEGEVVRILMRLHGTVFKVFAGGKEICQAGGYNAKYASTAGVKLWVADKFSVPARGTIANMVYKVGGQGDDAELWAPLAA